MKRVCVVLGSFNRLGMLQRAVESARRAGDGVDPGVVVVDGGSDDGTQDWVRAQGDCVLIQQELPLKGAVSAFNEGFGYAVEHDYPYVFHFNDDAEVLDAGAFAGSIAIMETDPKIGEVAFGFDLRKPGVFEYEHVNHRLYGNFGLVRTEAGKAVAVAQGDPSGHAWWNPIYRTYGADCEFGCWLWALGWKVVAGPYRVRDYNAQDSLRAENEAGSPGRHDSRLFWARWPSGANFETGPEPVTRLV